MAAAREQEGRVEEARLLRAPGLGSGIVPQFQQDGGPDPEAQRIGFPRDGREAERIAIEPGEAVEVSNDKGDATDAVWRGVQE